MSISAGLPLGLPSAPARARRPWRGAAMAVAVWSSAALVAGAFLWIVLDLALGGLSALSWSFLTEAPERAGRAGGIAPILVSTLLILATCIAGALPLGLGTAVLLAEFSRRDSPFARSVSFSLDVLAGVPSIVFGLFGHAFFCVALGLGYSILAGGLTLACMALPILVRSIELGLRSVPDDYRLAGAALGMSRARLVARVLLPAAAPALAAGMMLGIGRALAETAALIYTAGYVDRMPGSILDSGRALSLHVYDLAMNVPGGERNAYASALVLVGLLLAIHVLAHGASERLLGRAVERA